jgi:hypothetical protein
MTIRETWEPPSPDPGMHERIRQAGEKQMRRSRLRPGLIAAAAMFILAAGVAVAVGAHGRAAHFAAPTTIVQPPETVTEFLPLIDAPPPMLNGVLLRVSLPASRLEAAGIPVRAYSMREMVTAELLIGEDGLPRAIRFVNPQ